MSWMPDDDRFYAYWQARDEESEHLRRELERKYGPRPCAVCGERYEHVEGCSEAHKPKESDA